jgi:hypothetical protein
MSSNSREENFKFLLTGRFQEAGSDIFLGRKKKIIFVQHPAV